MGKVTLKIKHKCPYCNEYHNNLYTYHLLTTSDFMFIGDVAINIRAADSEHQSLLNAIGYCEKFNKEYRAEIGIFENKLTDLVLIKEDETY